ncbi:hypothetical protein Pyn_13097 [Prunus yedoensis var. nudiflora]|uniref:Uncharacterized protein n=1 Tax=Prunus yedoensis var. nudiflora TaxID=2094558 RepID=A0A314XZE5_PRUYE|nr:hypothetical protein Pyn_13097 [Prunus yedoensis var. nudiflora]
MAIFSTLIRSSSSDGLEIGVLVCLLCVKITTVVIQVSSILIGVASMVSGWVTVCQCVPIFSTLFRSSSNDGLEIAIFSTLIRSSSSDGFEIGVLVCLLCVKITTVVIQVSSILIGIASMVCQCVHKIHAWCLGGAAK